MRSSVGQMLLSVAVVLEAGAALAGGPAALRMAAFHCDATPPIGHPLVGGFSKPVQTVEDPLEARGIVLEDQHGRYVLCALDWCGLANSSYWLVRRKVAEAAGTEESRIAVHCLHQHTVPLADGLGRELMEKAAGQSKAIPMFDPAVLERLADRMAAAVRESLGRLEPFDRVGTGQARVERVASSRRILLADGTIATRMSSTKDPKLQALPEGKIDPYLKTITLARGDTPLVRLHYYATHPQSFYGDGRVSSDVPGLARRQVEGADGVFQVYFTGCAGDVAMGKYNDGAPQARSELTARLADAMKASIRSTQFQPVNRLTWRVVPLLLPLRNEGRFTVDRQREVLDDPAAPNAARIDAATYLAFAQRIDRPILLTSLELGGAMILHLPGEPMVEYQLAAQRMAPDTFVAVAGYGEYDPIYVCTEAAFSEGGYEPTEAWSAPHSEQILKKAIHDLLGRP
ncbi:MAG: hypothetical protein HUU20_13335 [Pirellulales bacterium]|nr:hypothetical protein [Pirellulales bacterium]